MTPRARPRVPWCAGRPWKLHERSMAKPARPKSAKLIPFPAARRVAFVSKLAKQMLVRTCTASEAHLRQQLEYQARVLIRKGIADDVARLEIRALENAVRV